MTERGGTSNDAGTTSLGGGVGKGSVVLEVERIGRSYTLGSGRVVEAIADVSFQVREREFCCVVGPSGCGKTTLLKLLAGLLKPTSGEARVHGARVVQPPLDMAFVFQDYGRSLMPWMTVLKNVVLPLERKVSRSDERRRLATEALVAVGLEEARDLHPWQLSGGMQQRVAIARALAYQADVMLLDEPFASVDAQTRSDLEDLLLQIWSEFGRTMLFVTHDIDESVYLADRVIALTTRPSRVRGIVDIPLSRPRDQMLTKGAADFAELRTQVYKLIRAESASSPAITTTKGDAQTLEEVDP